MEGNFWVCHARVRERVRGAFQRNRGVRFSSKPPRMRSVRSEFEQRLVFHHQESHFEKSRFEVSALRASAWYFSAITQAFLRWNESVRSAMRKFAERNSGKMKFCKPIFFLSPLAKG